MFVWTNSLQSVNTVATLQDEGKGHDYNQVQADAKVQKSFVSGYRISSKYGGDYFYFRTKRGRLFQIFLTGGREKVKYMNITIEKTVKKPVLL